MYVLLFVILNKLFNFWKGGLLLVFMFRIHRSNPGYHNRCNSPGGSPYPLPKRPHKFRVKSLKHGLSKFKDPISYLYVVGCVVTCFSFAQALVCFNKFFFTKNTATEFNEFNQIFKENSNKTQKQPHFRTDFTRCCTIQKKKLFVLVKRQPWCNISDMPSYPI